MLGTCVVPFSPACLLHCSIALVVILSSRFSFHILELVKITGVECYGCYQCSPQNYHSCCIHLPCVARNLKKKFAVAEKLRINSRQASLFCPNGYDRNTKRMTFP